MNFKLKVKNYKCFGDDFQGFEEIKPINIIIGKNNSGKSSLLDIVEAMREPAAFNAISEGSPNMVIRYTVELGQVGIQSIYHKDVSGDNIGANHYEYGKQFIGESITVDWGVNTDRKLVGMSKNMVIPNRHGLPQQGEAILIASTSQPFNGRKYRSISAERNIVPETQSNSHTIDSNGNGISSLIQEIINFDKLDRTLVEKTLLYGLNKITYPEIEFKKILTRRSQQGRWEIYLENSEGLAIPLSKMGSGIKTILQVLINLLVMPKLEKTQEDHYVFLFEELENNLHPSMQRRLFSYIKDYAERFKSIFFITTHSNVVIDLFGKDDLSQITHISDSIVKTVSNSTGVSDVLDDLEVKASDLYQSNGIIWVEGPSDRNYLLKWLSFIASDLKEGLHFSIMTYGGKLLSTLTFDYIDKELIPLLKINRNAYVIMDRDRRTINQDINKTKNRIKDEIGDNKCWITSGIEIENYLTANTINNWLRFKGKLNTKYKEEKFEKFENKISKYKINYPSLKNAYSKEIVEFITKKDLKVEDLQIRMEEIVKNIRTWNKMIVSPIEISSATYGIPLKHENVKKALLKLIELGITKGVALPETFGIDDPVPGKQKRLLVKYTNRGIEGNIDCVDGEQFEFK